MWIVAKVNNKEFNTFKKALMSNLGIVPEIYGPKILIDKLIKKKKAKVVGYACLINRSNKKTLKIKKGKIISQIKLDVPTYSKKNLPNFLKKIPITKPGSRFLR